METVPVRLQQSSYPIHIGSQILSRLGELLSPFPLSRKAFLFTDPTVNDLFGREAQQALRQAGFSPFLFLVPPGERNKSLAWVRRAYDFLIQEGADRKSPVVALGGGVIGDLAGFVAATFMRGVPLVQVPTSLLAQIDSSVGGKVAVNHPGGKNLIGAFYQPLLVMIDVTLVETLPERDFRAALAEVIKYGLIYDSSFFSYLEQNLDRLLELDREVLSFVVKRCCEIKAAVVGRDEREEGIRAILNYGHTVGHALEAATNFRIYRHGEAVAIGMEAEGRIAEYLGLWGGEQRRRQQGILMSAGLPLSTQARPERLLRLMYRDKKVRDGRTFFALTRGIGDAIVQEIEEGLILRALREMRRKSA